MKTFIKVFSYLLCLVSYLSYPQDLAIKSGSSLTVLPGTDFYVNGINFNPSSLNFTLNGPIDFSRTATPVGASIDRVFNFSNAITNFQGDVTFFYEDSELVASSANELTIVLRTKDGATWGIDLIPIRKGGLNTLTYNFPTSTNFSSITASKPGITLSVSKFNELKINLFPNPVISSFQITTDLTIETLIYNNLGQAVFKSNEKNIDVSQLSAGTYLIIVKDLNSNNFNSYQIIKL
ncbi:T9SS type A sorting domain-containing protein [Lutibacter flavus]|uniref:Por secretion system C-terminal sorting domain-containing protein n=1 Tax=Lutibacter flavus TaxID=691689 RepID=A0A238YUA9_9FLAO|nr:T9SS type A sorting domain-containing protein [Lutibacter flavus]SNR74039.1 Por secretion system C-terminal sorting domain-containing protein [Lutibacter flavus]